MPSLSEVRAYNAAFSHSPLPVALFVGGTSGIGRATAEAFARYTKGEAHIIICGRNRAAAESIIATFPKSSKGHYEFVECDVSLMKNIEVVTTKLLSTIPKLNFLVLSTGLLNFTTGRDDTSDALPKKLVTDYYSRWKFVHDLMPLLRNAKDAGEDAKVLSVLAAGYGGPVNLDDLELKEYSFSKEMKAAATYNDIMVESFSAQEPDMAFTHMYPGVVRTPILYSNWILKALYPLVYLLTYFSAHSPSVSAEYHLHALLEGEKGWFRRGPKGEALEKTEKNYFSTEEAKKKLWEHTVEVTRVG